MIWILTIFTCFFEKHKESKNSGRIYTMTKIDYVKARSSNGNWFSLYQAAIFRIIMTVFNNWQRVHAKRQTILDAVNVKYNTIYIKYLGEFFVKSLKVLVSILIIPILDTKDLLFHLLFSMCSVFQYLIIMAKK